MIITPRKPLAHPDNCAHCSSIVVRRLSFWQRAVLGRACSRTSSWSNSRRRVRALCNCDFRISNRHPMMSAISLCSYPWTSCSTKTVGSLGQFSDRTFQIHPVHGAAKRRSGAPTSFRGRLFLLSGSWSLRARHRGDFLAQPINTT